MTERPILFSSSMVRALLAGTKTQTRRALRGFKPRNTPEYDSESGRLEWFNGDEVVCGMRCPYGQPGDRLWVRETWARNADQLSDTRMDTSLERHASAAYWDRAGIQAYQNMRLFG